MISIVVGAVIGGIFFLVFLIVMLIFLCRWRANQTRGAARPYYADNQGAAIQMATINTTTHSYDQKPQQYPPYPGGQYPAYPYPTPAYHPPNESSTDDLPPSFNEAIASPYPIQQNPYGAYPPAQGQFAQPYPPQPYPPQPYPSAYPPQGGPYPPQQNPSN